jgi:poly(U)-specific endoribonuclease
MDIYQAIWDADMEGNGLQPIPSAKNGDKTQGFVVVDTESEHHILKEVCIPDRKKEAISWWKSSLITTH